jgi:hypothetical protein
MPVLGSERITTTGQVVGFAAIPQGADQAHIQADGADVRYRLDGSHPSATVGMVAYDNAAPTKIVGKLAQVRLWLTGGGLEVTYYGPHPVHGIDDNDAEEGEESSSSTSSGGSSLSSASSSSSSSSFSSSKSSSESSQSASSSLSSSSLSSSSRSSSSSSSGDSSQSDSSRSA